MQRMAIQNRRGAYADFDPSKLKPGEYAIVQSGDPSTTEGDAIYICIKSGTVRRLATADEVNDYEEVIQLLKDETQALKNQTADLHTATAALAERYQQAIDAVEAKKNQIIAYTANSDQIAGQAMQKANEVSAALATQGVDIDQLKQKTNLLQLLLDGVATNGYYDASTSYIYLTNDAGEVVGDPIGPVVGGSGGGGGGGGGETINAKLTVTDNTGWRSRTIAAGDPCRLSIYWTSIEDDLETGNGTARITVGGVIKGFVDIAQGDVVLDISRYLSTGSNSVAVTISDVYGQARTIRYTVQVELLSISSTFDASVAHTGVISFPFTPVGAVTKTVRFLVDGVQIGTMETAVTNRQLTYSIPAQSHGAHTLDVYFDADINGVTVQSNVLHYEILCTEALNDQRIIACPFNTTECAQYTTLQFTYNVYDPNALTADVVIEVNDQVFQQVTVDRTTQAFSVRAADVGNLKVEITSGNADPKVFNITVTESDIQVEPETESLKLALSAYGRSNNEANPGSWTYGTAGESDYVACTFTNFQFVNDGWKQDEDGSTVLRTTGDAVLTIPYKIFQNDPRSTGKTIEIELATREVMDYDAEILTCWANNKGLKMTPQSAVFKSEQSEVDIQFKEEEHIRLAFVVEKRSKNRLVYVYINGIMSQVVQYPNVDDFQQTSPANIVIGSTDATVDIYSIRIYDNDLSSEQVVNNWIAETQDVDLMLERYTRNNIYDAYGSVVISKLPKTLPYFVLNAEELPQYKGDNKVITGEYVDPANPAKSFTFTNCKINVQGTSSAVYYRKNFDMQFKSGFEMNGGSHADNYALADTVIPFNRFVLKADVASSEGANNTELTMLFCDKVPYKTPEQVENPKVRQGIYGFPILVFWHNTTNDTTQLMGKYNFNLPKRAPGPYGFHDDMESWEWQNNTSNRVLFKSADFSETYIDPETGETKYAWRDDFEARFPSDEWTDVTQLQAWLAWTVSTDRTAATNEALAESVTYDGVEYATDSADYRLAKFKAEVSDWVEMDSALFYYVFTELFLMVDSRAKNMFPSFAGSTASQDLPIDRKVIFMPYDMDTALGTNNEGLLAFSYNLEDTDTLAGADVFNGQHSVFWNNLRDAFPARIRDMYQTMRTTIGISYADIERRFTNHQRQWSESIFNEDSVIKYIDPLVNDGNGAYISMLQGDKMQQRNWWMYNRLRYCDSKWNAGDALQNTVIVRGYAKADITVKPYSDIYPSIRYGSVLVQTRGQRNTSYTLACPLDNVNDTETHIFSADQLLEINGLPAYQVGFADFSAGRKLKSIVVGSNASGYSNPNLTELNIGNLPLLKNIDVRNCPNLAQTVDLSQCVNLENVYFDGSGIAGVDLANGAAIKVLHLPATVTNLTLRNLQNLTDFTMAGYSNISTLWLEGNNSRVNPYTIFNACAAGARIRLLGIQWSISSNTSAFIERLEGMRGLDENGNNTEHAQLSGSIYFSTISGSQLQTMRDHYPNVTVTYGTLKYSVDMYSEDGATLLKSNEVSAGGTVSSYTPSKASTAQYTYTFAGWANSVGGAVDANALKNIQSDKKIYAVFTPVLRTYTVYFYNESTLLQTVNNVPYGGTATFTGSEPTKEGYEFSGWSPSPSNITGNTSCYAQFELVQLEVTEITDSWETIKANIDNGTYATKYKVGMYKTLDLGTEGQIRMQVAGINKDVLADGTGNAPMTWIAMDLLNTYHRMNPNNQYTYTYPQGASFKRSSTSTSNTGYNKWDAQNTYSADNTAKITHTVTAVADGTLRLTYVTGASSGNNTSLKVDGTEVVSSHSTSAQNYDLPITNGTTYTIVFETTRLTTSDTTTVYIKLCNTSGSGKKADVDALISQTTPIIEDCAVRTQSGYVNGTGNIGGWPMCEMRTYLKETIKPLMPATVRNALKTVTKYTTTQEISGSSYTKSANTVSQDDVWIPSYREVGFTSSYYESQGVKYSALFPANSNRVRAKVGGSAYYWFLRSSYYNDTNYFTGVSNDGSYYTLYCYTTNGVVLGFCM